MSAVALKKQMAEEVALLSHQASVRREHEFLTNTKDVAKTSCRQSGLIALMQADVFFFPSEIMNIEGFLFLPRASLKFVAQNLTISRQQMRPRYCHARKRQIRSLQL